MDQLQGKVALVTGGGSTIGRAVCLAFAAEGARVVVADQDRDRADEVARTVVEAGGEAQVAAVDFREEEQIQSLLSDAIVSYGTLHVLLNGALVKHSGDPIGTSADAWRESLAINLESAWHCARFAAPFLKSSGGGSIIHLAPTDVLRSMPRRFPYSVSRAGILAMSRALAIDFGPQGIRSNVVLMGHIQSEETREELAGSADPDGDFRRALAVHPLGRVGTPEDVAAAAVFLASDAAAFVTGSVLTVDGGRSAVVQELHNWST